MAFYNPLRPAYIVDPYPSLARLRASDPVYRAADLDAWIVTSYEDCARVLQDDDHFSSDPALAAGGLGAAVRHNRSVAALGQAAIMANSDPPEHTRLRNVINRAFTPRALAAFQPSVQQIANSLLDDIPRDRPFDLMSAFAEPLHVITILDMLGVPTDERGLFRDIVVAIMRARMDAAAMPDSVAQSRAAAAELRALVFERSSEAGDGRGSLLATLVAATKAGEISEDEALMLAVHVATAGNAATAYLIGNGARAFAEHPDQWEELRANRALLPAAIEEVFRFDGPTHITTRFARGTSALHGRRILAGQTLHLVVGAANRDPAQFPDPDRFDMHRSGTRHASFALGIHFCLGAPLARIEAELAFTALLDRFLPLRVAPGGYEPGGTLLLRGPKRLVLLPAEHGGAT